MILCVWFTGASINMNININFIDININIHLNINIININININISPALLKVSKRVAEERTYFQEVTTKTMTASAELRTSTIADAVLEILKRLQIKFPPSTMEEILGVMPDAKFQAKVAKLQINLIKGVAVEYCVYDPVKKGSVICVFYEIWGFQDQGHRDVRYVGCGRLQGRPRGSAGQVEKVGRS